MTDPLDRAHEYAQRLRMLSAGKPSDLPGRSHRWGVRRALKEDYRYLARSFDSLDEPEDCQSALATLKSKLRELAEAWEQNSWQWPVRQGATLRRFARDLLAAIGEDK